jgi:chromatin remodeling complex protein RSC6
MSKTPAKKTTKSDEAKSSGGKARGGAFNAPLKPSPQLAAVVGDAPLPRTEAVSKMWDYIKKHKLQNEQNKREILADDKLKPIFGKDKATMFEMSAFLAKHLAKAG